MEYTGKTIEIFPIKGYCELILFQTKHDLKVTASTYPDDIVPIVGAGKSKTDEDFPNVFIALRKNAEKDLLREHIKMLSEKAKQTTEAADLDRLTGAICTAVVTLQNLA